MELHSAQIRALKKLKKNKFQGIAWWKPGEGKTRLGLACLLSSTIRHCVYVVREQSKGDVIEEIKKCKLPYLPVDVEKVKEEMLTFKLVMLVTPDSLHKIPKFLDISDCILILDELHLFANFKSIRGKKAIKLARESKAVIGMSATIMPAKDNIRIYGQALAVGIHPLLAKTITEFYSKYKISILSHVTPSGKQWVNKPGSYKAILNALGPYVDLHYPDNQHRNVRSKLVKTLLTNEQKKHIKKVTDTWKINGKEVKHAITIAHEINKIGNGWSKDSKGNLLHYKCNKSQSLLAIVEELYDAGESVVIWCAYRDDVQYLKSIIPYKTLVYTSGSEFSPDDLSSESPNIVLATESYGLGVNHFRNFEYGIFYSLTRKWTDLQQSQGRHERKDSTHMGAFYYFMLNQDSEIETTIYESVIQSRDVENKFIIEAINKQKQNDNN